MNNWIYILILNENWISVHLHIPSNKIIDLKSKKKKKNILVPDDFFFYNILNIFDVK